MRILRSSRFNKQFARLTARVQEAYIERNCIFRENRRNPLLHDHLLKAEWAGHRSINVTGDYRAVYREIADNTFEFVAIGTHHQLFGK